ncbi:MAG TPA: substrate-binding domain-containing protein [Pirellulales bacterium]|jgi:LacI family transcriptional regulator
MRRKQIAIVLQTVNGCRRPIVLGVSRYTAQRADWSLRWCFVDRSPLDEGYLSNVDGILCVTEDPAWAESVFNRSRPVVLAGCRPLAADHGAVFCDPEKTGALAAQHLHQSGHDHLACLYQQGELGESLRRGFVEQARRQEVEAKVLCLPATSDEMNNGFQATISDWLLKLPRPTGLFVSCDRWGANLCELARESHIVVPEDLAVIAPGNDLDIASMSRPALSIVEQPCENIGLQAAALLADMLGGGTSRHVALSPQQVLRCASTDSLATADVNVRQAVEYIRQNAHRPIGVRDVLKSVHSSRRALEQRFRRALRRTIMEEIRRTRFELASSFLAKGSLPISQVALQCGLGSSAHLNQLTRRYTGLSPREVRQRARLES